MTYIDSFYQGDTGRLTLHASYAALEEQDFVKALDLLDGHVREAEGLGFMVPTRDDSSWWVDEAGATQIQLHRIPAQRGA